MENQVNDRKSSYTVTKYNAIFSIIIISLIIASLCLSVSMGVSFRRFCDHQTQYSENIKSSKILRESYDNLTTQFRRFIINQKMDGYTAYFEEFDSGRRDAAIQALATGTEGGNLLGNALANVNEITDYEMHAMALASKAAGLDFSTLRSEIANYPLTSEERSMSQIELRNKANQMAFGDEFGAQAERIDAIIEQYSNTLLIENAEEVARIKNSVAIHIIAIVLCLVSLVVIAFVVFSTQNEKVVTPLTTIQKQLENKSPLSEDIGINEIRQITVAYNKQMDELKCAHSVEASYQRALIADSEIVYEVNVSKDLITRVISEDDNHPFTMLLTSLGLTLPCSLNKYSQSVKKIIPNSEKTVFNTLSCENMIKEYKSGCLSSFSDSELTLFGVTKKVRSIALYREDPKTRDIIAMIVIKDNHLKGW